MFDVRPVDRSGGLDLEKIEKVGKAFRNYEAGNRLEKESWPDAFSKAKSFKEINKSSLSKAKIQKHSSDVVRERDRSIFESFPVSGTWENYDEKSEKKHRAQPVSPKENIKFTENISFSKHPNLSSDSDCYKAKPAGFPQNQEPERIAISYSVPKRSKNKRKLSFEKPNFGRHFNFRFLGDFIYNPFNRKKAFVFARVAAITMVLFFLSNVAYRGIKLKTEGLAAGQEALAEMISAKDSLARQDFETSSIKFKDANAKLAGISKELDGMGGSLLNLTKYVPFLSKLSSGNHLVSAGKDISQIGILISDILSQFDRLRSSGSQTKEISYLALFRDNEKNLKDISELFKNVENDLDKVNLDDIPENKRNQIIEIKKRLPEINGLLDEFLGEERVFADILGANGPRKYLFLFQNNQEMRATGGFIGSYAILDIFEGRVRNFKIDGIFNPDGQLKERIIPPAPIQKISANWSLHDSNWFPDFPVSAEKAIWFYEKTGGPTVDGVITMTPTVMQKLLEITGPIEMPEYGVTVDKDNFIEKIQYEVEVDYDKELNQPKKILADLAPKILDKIFNASDMESVIKTMNVLLESLNEKHILIYSRNWQMENMLSDNGWTGEVLKTPKDYLSVINTNINGFKTDGVIDEEISHNAKIGEDGTIVDTVKITRHHNGGDSNYDWWNKVNVDYMRLYVPEGSRLLSVSGQTREFNAPPLDYKTLGFKRDPQVEMEESSTRIDDDSGTQIYTDAGKTVFANWVYVSPKETVTIEYSYVLPFKLEMNVKKPADSYSLLIQKQSGSSGSKFKSTVEYPKNWKTIWTYPEDLLFEGNAIKMENGLETDRFIGTAFTK